MSEPAPSALEGPRAPLTIYAGGLATSAIALCLVWFASEHGENIMGLYGYYVLPVGAFMVGLVAASGYGIASYASGTKVKGRLLWRVLALLVASYWAAQYLEFHLRFPQGARLADGTSVSFWEYYDILTRSFFWKAKHSGDTNGSAMGTLGYLLRLGEIVGYCSGGILIPISLLSVPHCERCQVYKKSKRLALFPAGVKVRKAKKPEEKESYEAEIRAARAQGIDLCVSIFAAARSDATALNAALASAPSLGNYAAQKLTGRVSIWILRCPRCHEGVLTAHYETGAGKQISYVLIGGEPVSPEVVQGCFGGSSRDPMRASS